jgi:Fe-S-cluster containining protein
VDFTYPINLRFDCNKCGLCCGNTQQKTRHILLLKSEAKQIALQTSLPMVEFSSKAKDNAPYCYEIKKSSEGKCIFLKENQCTIYEFRPLICMFYPFQLTFDNGKRLYVFDFTLECPGINQVNLFTEKDFEKLFNLAQARLT